MSLDIADAYLTVRQTRLVKVTHKDQRYVLGRVLPGQRPAAKEWYESFSKYLDEKLSYEKCLALPSLMRSPDHKFFMQLHVDDMLGAGSYKHFCSLLLKPNTKFVCR